MVEEGGGAAPAARTVRVTPRSPRYPPSARHRSPRDATRGIPQRPPTANRVRGQQIQHGRGSVEEGSQEAFSGSKTRG